jgi:hypothetical protein
VSRVLEAPVEQDQASALMDCRGDGWAIDRRWVCTGALLDGFFGFSQRIRACSFW